MPRWTAEQQLAIDKEGTNIIVSAGAGSGKTAVLSERVIRKLEQGVDIDRLLILTFTKAAAFEMMIRIRNKIKERPNLKAQLDKIDASYITTFDSFSLSLVKKYHYLLNISRSVKIGNQTIINQEREKILDKIFDDYYESQDKTFLAFLDAFTLKDDKEVKNAILTMNAKLDLKYDKFFYLKNYTKNYEEKTRHFMKMFEDFLQMRLNKIKSIMEELSYLVSGDYYGSVEDVLLPLVNAKNYDEILANSKELKLKNLPKGSGDEAKACKDKLSSALKEIKEYLIYESSEKIEKSILDQKDFIKLIVDILDRLDKEIYIYKYSRDIYEFTDISKMAIKLVKENKEIRDDLKYYFNEIMVDEYQDTSDLQEEFISSIANDNVYMVGDIKQSIYRFRNANPYIFKNKYDNYGQGNGGFKIDLMKNFRSRKEVLANINDVFDYIMDDVFGGCDYRGEHRMIFGNTSYEENKSDVQDSNFEVYNYTRQVGYTKDEMEAFIILKDIKEKVDNHYQVIDRDTFTLRDARFGDFAILVDRASKFELFKKIFEYHQVPMAVFKDMTITKEDDIYIISHLLRFVYLMYHKDFGEDFRYSYMSISRSYLLQETDATIFKVLEEKNYQETELFRKLSPIVKEYPYLNGSALIDRLIEEFEFYKKQILVGNMEMLMARISYVKDIFKEMSDVGYSVDDAIFMFNKMVEEGQEIRISVSEDTPDAVKIMTIHKSKGLEFPVLYMSGLSNKFNIRDLNEKFIYDLKYGFLFPFYQEEEKTNICKFLLKNDYLKEEIGEKIRLFYVALTRAREKMILVTNNEKEDEFENSLDVVADDIRGRYRSFLDILKSVWNVLTPYKKEINVEDLGLSKDYNFVRTTNLKSVLKKSKQKVFYKPFDYERKVITSERFSKTGELFTPDANDAIELGKRFHHIFESIDFKRPDLSHLSSFEKKQVEAFLKLDILKDIQADVIFREYEFMYNQGKTRRHGIIDLMIEKQDKIIIVDYKLKHVVDSAYKKQLNGYKEYVETKSDKPVEVYLYSILDQNLTQVI